VNPEHKSPHSAWETPDPGFWTKHGYVVVRADERGLGQSPGLLDTMSRGTSEAFFDVVEWAAEQHWSSGKTGLLGISYYGGSQWRVAARQPKGLACIIPWEGMSDYYRDRCRHGGILSSKVRPLMPSPTVSDSIRSRTKTVHSLLVGQASTFQPIRSWWPRSEKMGPRHYRGRLICLGTRGESSRSECRQC